MISAATAVRFAARLHKGIDGLLRRIGFTYKKSLIADERRKPHVRPARRNWFRWRLPAIAQAPRRVVFIDETSVKTNMTRQRGRSLVENA